MIKIFDTPYGEVLVVRSERLLTAYVTCKDGHVARCDFDYDTDGDAYADFLELHQQGMEDFAESVVNR